MTGSAITGSPPPKDAASLLRQVPILASLAPEQMNEATDLAEIHRYEANTVVLRAGETPAALYIVREGALGLFAQRDGRPIELVRLSPGEYFGDLSLFDATPHGATVIAHVATEVLVLPRARLLPLLSRRAEAPVRLLGLLAARIRRSDQLIEHLASKNVNELAERRTLGQRAADAAARFGGSWAFIGLFLAINCGWIAANLRPHPLDPYPYIFLNLLLTLVTTLQAPFIMMSQTRQASKARLRSDLDYQVNLKNETTAEDIKESLEELRRVTLAREIRRLRQGHGK